MTETARKWHHKYLFPGSRSAFLLVGLFLLLAIYPQFEEQGGGDRADHYMEKLFLYICFTFILLGAAWLVHDRRKTLIISCILTIPCVTLGWIDHATGFTEPIRGFISLLFAASTLYAALSQLGFILRAKKIDADLLCRAISVYLLLGVAWMAMYGSVEHYLPNSFHASEPAAFHGPHHKIGYSDHLYYSFSTLTTLGIGDITPVSSVARSLTILECVIGPLYMAVLLARLVSMYGRERGSTSH